MPGILIAGAGDLGRQLAALVRSVEGTDVVGYLDDTMDPGTVVDGIAVLGGMDAAEQCFSDSGAEGFLVGIGYRHFAFREQCFDRLRACANPYTFIHPNAFVDASASVGEGSVIYAGCVLDQQCVVGENVLLNVGCSLAHDGTVGAHSFFGPGVITAGNVRIGARNFVGVGTVVSDGIRTADDVQTGAGAVVVRDCEESGLYVGVPARLRR